MAGFQEPEKINQEKETAKFNRSTDVEKPPIEESEATFKLNFEDFQTPTLYNIRYLELCII